MRAVLPLVLLAGAVRAGPYNPEEPFRPISQETARRDILQAKGALLAPKGKLDPASPRARWLESIKRLDAASSTQDRLARSAYLLRVGEPRKAREALKDADQGDFLVQANLAAAFNAEGNLRDAIRCQEKALELWPENHHAWPTTVSLFYRRCERAFLALLKSREAESRRAGSDPLPIDPIFPGLRLEEPARKGGRLRYYAVDGMPLAQREKVPPGCADLVVQLLLWMPADHRLYWLYGELAALENPEAGFQLIEDIAFGTGDGAAFLNLRAHRTALKDAARAFKELRSIDGQCSLAVAGMLLGHGVQPTGPGPTAGLLMLKAAVPVLAKPPKEPEPPGGFGLGQPAAALPFNAVHVGVSFGFGALAAALIGLQWQEWRRRRRQS
ncbi:MAG: hypothetical protein K2W96_24275 [Gemmataceae bacterium]|nr:hypothetical protein [Gemmataceae bacterium]